jgi:aspartyl-tRNA(Asn)/glutamyl-tRNA(Gln) amidotransferase subunit C
MSLDRETVRRVASLARIRLEEEELLRLQGELNGILGWIEQLQSVDTEGVEPLAGAAQMVLRMREDAVTDGGIRERILANAPDREGDFFGVPKVVE